MSRTTRALQVKDISQSPVPVPLPTELPPPPDLAGLPVQILHSGTVETLIGQNEDLFARLKVNIRRNSILEAQIMEQERINSETSRINSSLTSQLQILQEKDRIWRDKSQKNEKIHEGLKEELELLRLAVREGQGANQALHSFYRRVKRWVRPYLKKLKTELAAERARLKTAEERVSARDAQLSDLRSRLAEAMTHLQKQQNIYGKDQSKLVERYEGREAKLRDEVEKARGEALLIREKAAGFELSAQRAAEAENRVIYLERKCSELERRFQTELTELQNAMATFRTEAKTLALEKVDLESELTKRSGEVDGLNLKIRSLRDELESSKLLLTKFHTKMSAESPMNETALSSASTRIESVLMNLEAGLPAEQKHMHALEIVERESDASI